MLALALAAALTATTAHADGGAEEVVVYDDPFARWDDTRWVVHVQFGWPIPVVLSEGDVHSRGIEAVDVRALDLTLVIGCEKTFRRSATLHEVLCGIRDVGLQAAPPDPTPADPTDLAWVPAAEAVLHDLDDRLTGAGLRIYADADGRLSHVELEGVPSENWWSRRAYVQLRTLLGRVIVGFDLQLPRDGVLKPGRQWVEYGSRTMMLPNTLPVGPPRWVKGGSPLSRTRVVLATTTYGDSELIHQLNRYKGHLLVQSTGHGKTTAGEAGFRNLAFRAVSVFDDDDGVMTERTWTLWTGYVPGQFSKEAVPDPYLFESGHLRLLGKDEPFDVGPSRVVAAPAVDPAGLPPWVPLE